MAAMVAAGISWSHSAIKAARLPRPERYSRISAIFTFACASKALILATIPGTSVLLTIRVG